jgi:hypothetical protein
VKAPRLDELGDYPELVALSVHTKVAEHLCGRPVMVRFRRPRVRNYVGCPYKTEDGQAIIDLDRERAGYLALKVFLHECAHIRLHFEAFSPGDSYRAPSGSDALSPLVTVATYRKQPRETEADRLAERWLKAARAGAGRFLRSGLDASLWPLMALLRDPGDE